MATISGFIICKDEETGIERALQSLSSVCDEIIVVDTGSIDHTKEIARKYTNKIYDFAWIDDFSAARNFAIEKCAGDWIIYVDADDEITPDMQIKIRGPVEKASPQTAGFYVNYQYGPNNFQLVPRIWKSRHGLKFEMPIHEYLAIPPVLRSHFVIYGDMVMVHHKTSQENAASTQRNIALLEKNIQRDPLNAHFRFFLGREYFDSEKHEEAFRIFKNLIEDRSVQDRSFLYQIYRYLGKCSEKFSDFTMALECYVKAFESDSRFADPLVAQGNILLYQLKNADEARKFYEKALDIPYPHTNFPVNPKLYHDYPREQIRKIDHLHKPVALVCGYYGMLNIGDELMLASILQHFPSHRTIVASYVPAVTSRLHKTESVPYGHAYFDQVLKDASLVIIGGGTLFHDQGLRENHNVAFYCEIIARAHALGKKIILLGIGVDRLHFEENKKLLRDTFGYCHAIFVRDQHSRKNLLEYGVQAHRVQVIPDLAFGYEYPRLNRRNVHSNQRPLIGINLCLPIKDSSDKLIRQIEDFLLPFLERMKDRYDFIFLTGQATDLRYQEYFKLKLPFTLTFFEPDQDRYFESYWETIDRCDILIASRYHFLLLGLLWQKPTYALSYSEKTDCLLEDFRDYLNPFQGEVQEENLPDILNQAKRSSLGNELEKIFNSII